jgi:HTH-type transcriptional regulator/antitoxin HigA
MATQGRPGQLPDTYFSLVEEFPLVHIKNNRHLRQAQEMLNTLLQQNLDEGGKAYLDVLTDLVESYEDEHEPISDAPPQDVLRILVESSGLTQQQLAVKVGIAQSTLSALLRRVRPMTTAHMVKLAAHFGVPPAVFLPGSKPSA